MKARVKAGERYEKRKNKKNDEYPIRFQSFHPSFLFQSPRDAYEESRAKKYEYECSSARHFCFQVMFLCDNSLQNILLLNIIKNCRDK